MTRIWEVEFYNEKGAWYSDKHNEIKVDTPNALHAIISAKKKMKDIKYCTTHDVSSVKLVAESI